MLESSILCLERLHLGVLIPHRMMAPKAWTHSRMSISLSYSPELVLERPFSRPAHPHANSRKAECMRQRERVFGGRTPGDRMRLVTDAEHLPRTARDAAPHVFPLEGIPSSRPSLAKT